MTSRSDVTEVRDLALSISDSLSRGKGNVGLASKGRSFVLMAGAPTAVNVAGGVIVALGLSRERLVELRAECDRLLGQNQSEFAMLRRQRVTCL